jgi:hypothetical protein
MLKKHIWVLFIFTLCAHPVYSSQMLEDFKENHASTGAMKKVGATVPYTVTGALIGNLIGDICPKLGQTNGTFAGIFLGAFIGYLTSVSIPSWERLGTRIKSILLQKNDSMELHDKDLKRNDKYIILSSLLQIGLFPPSLYLSGLSLQNLIRKYQN